MKTFYSTGMPRSLYYRSDGSGRDTYISINNGGLYQPTQARQEVPLGSFPRNRYYSSRRPISANKIVKYTTDGSGRDIYIYGGQGGFEPYEIVPENKTQFAAQLRTYRPIQSAHGVRDYSRTWRPSSHIAKTRKLRQQQLEQVDRLSRPKHNV